MSSCRATNAKAREIGATRWDFGNADHYSMANYPGGFGW